MQSAASPDLSSLARLAQNPDSDLRPVLLRVQAQTFAQAPRRDAGTVAAFEAIALGLIPLVTDDVLSTTAAMLRSIPETPPSVLAALTSRLVRLFDPKDDGADADEGLPAETDLSAEAIVRDPELVLDGHLLADLVDQARDNPDLATLLLARHELTAFDRAALYRHADTKGRARIRTELKSASPLWTQSLRNPAPERLRTLVLRAAELGDVEDLQRLAASHLGLVPDGRFDLVTEAGRELFVCTLLAFGFQPAECIRIILNVDGAMARSVSTVFSLAALARSTPVWVAALLAGCHQARGAGPDRTTDHRPAPVAGTLRADGRADPVSPRIALVEPTQAPRAKGE